MNKVIKYDSVLLRSQLNSKNFSLQFLPVCIEEMVKNDKFTFNNKELKSSYLVDIIHNLILKYYFRKENRFVLNAEVLKDKYGFLYNYYINYLLYNNILVLVSNYKIGYQSRTYSLNEDIFDKKISRYKNYDRVLVKKFKRKFTDIESYNSLIDLDIKEKLISDLFSVKVDYDRSIYFLDTLKDKNIDLYNRNVYSIDCINNGHIFYHFDDYGRMHTNFTILRSFIRKNCLTIDGDEICEIDIPNSQPLFLSKIISDSNSKWVDESEFKLFKQLVINGRFYQYIMSKLKIDDKKSVKEIVYKVLFGKNMGNSKADKFFRDLFPTIHNFIKLYKKENGNYKILAYDLQRAESNLIFNKIIKKIAYLCEGAKIVTIHDSILVQRQYKEIVENIFNDELCKNLDNINNI